MWSTAHAYYVILSKKFPPLPCPLEDHARVSISRLTYHQGLAGNSEYATQADWVIDSNLALVILPYSMLYGRCHLVCVGQVQCYPGVWNFRQYCLIFYSIQMPICYLCSMITNTWTYISIYIRNTDILENKKICLYFSASMSEHL